MDGLLLQLVHFIGNLGLLGEPAHGSILSPGKRSFDLEVDLRNHMVKLLNQLVYVATFVSAHVSVAFVLLLQVVVMALFARADVRLRVGEQVIGTEGQKVEFANLPT